MAASVVLQNVVKRYGAFDVIRGVDLVIQPGEFVVFVGPSGCGKSTLLRMIAGLEHITGGALVIDGERLNDVPAAKRGIAMVFQSYALYPHMTVYKNLAFGLETAGFKNAEVKERVEQAADILQIRPLLDRKPKQLSGGQRQRVAIGRAIVREPRIFLFDEPLSNLDAELRVQMRLEIANLHHGLGSTMIYVTHDQVEAMTMADKIVVLHAGLVEQVGTPLDLYNNPANRFVAGFIGSPKMNFLNATLRNPTGSAATINVADEAIHLSRPVGGSEGSPLTVGVRPEHLFAGVGGTRLADVRVELVEQLGGETLLYTTMADGQALTISLGGQQNIAPGCVIPVHLDPTRCHIFGEDGRAL
ncbi:ABC transporter ATP-binding protein [Bradyrhizobium sp. BR 1432]|uniref:ABC transporter ATP-binding protein n=1 Tax=Bradyrhizobium sp. BR 1432 TaxID=3447966 RepID=UPI003EE78A83